MKIGFKSIDQTLRKFQEGGEINQEAAAAETAATPEQGGGDPMEQILAACQQALQSQDCNIAMQVCQALMQMAGGQPEPQGQPVYKKGGKLSRWIQK